ncbi:nephrin-like isoform X2 [Penaeus japonicus]|uniref:nephrin-like isoform X2 n=1 Tax=Penaeus japonicus TaxID=27405 RepID=UPI001C7108C3|nr:nephrin-like isoform X2 [Penaeus japonicus]
MNYDVRRGPPSHWANPSAMGDRAKFDAATASLVVQRVQEEDEGMFRCRVDFRTNPTLTFTSNLTVIVPPRRVGVYTERGVEARSIVGPFTEGETLRLACRVEGGSPSPRVTWWEGSVLLDATLDSSEVGYVTNTLEVSPLTRQDLHRTLTCQATNTNLTAPLAATVTLDMNFPPLWVRLLSSRDALSAGRQYVVVCQAVGAKPPANITWYLGPTRLTTHFEERSHEGNVTTSSLRFTPTVADAGQVLACVSDSRAVNSRVMMDEWKLDIYYVPVAKIQPGGSLNLSNIEEGDDVYFECAIAANPRVYKIVWRRDDQELRHNVSAGIITSNRSLVLQHVSRTASGKYHCVASNIEGDGKSEDITLSVKYSPVCRENQMMYHGAARYEQVNIPCELDAHPPPVSFRWTFNNSGESVDIPQNHIMVEGSRATVSYTPNTELDYGTLLCWGANAVGVQRHPCVFHVFPAGPPDPVHNCSVYNLSVTVVNVRCLAGFDGGLPQTFILELYDPHTNILMGNITNKVPKFSVPGLPPGVGLLGVVYSTNAKGRGQMINLQVFTLKDVAERRTAAVKPPPHASLSSVRLTAIIAVVLGVMGGLLVVAILICAVLRLRDGRGDARARARAGDVKTKDRGRERPQEGGGQDEGASKTPLTTSLKEVQGRAGSPRDYDEKNPDVIPQSDSESWPTEGVNTISSASLPPTYSALPRTSAQVYSHGNYQAECGSDVQYAELLLSGTTITTTPRPHDQHKVIYTTLDHKHVLPPYSSPQPHPSYTQPSIPPSSSSPPPPTHLLQQGGSQHHLGGTWTTPCATTSPRQPLLRRDSHHADDSLKADPEVRVPLIPNQKESSV